MQSFATHPDFSLKAKKLLFLHFFICSFGLVKLAMVFAENIYQAKFLEFAVSQLGYSAYLVGVGKLGAFLQYVLGVLFLCVFCAFILWMLSRVSFRESVFNKNKIVIAIFFSVNIFLNYRLFFAGQSVSHWLPFWLLFALVMPLSNFNFSWKIMPELPKWLVYILLGFILLQIGLVFKPYISKPMLIENEYMDISGQTVLQSGKWVDNTQFINEHHIGGIVKYDPRVDHGMAPLPLEGTYVKINHSPLLSVIIDAEQYGKDGTYYLSYREKEGILSVTGELTPEVHRTLRYAFANLADKQKIDELYLLSLQQNKLDKARVYTAEEWDFFHKNKMELLDQARTGWFFYHHNYFFEPIIAAALGAKNQPFVYGWLSSLLFVKLLPYLGGVNYQSYFKLFFSIYPLYYLSFFAILLFIFRRAEYALLGLMLSVSALFALGLQDILHAPGFNPVRHFLDIFVFLTFFYYIRRQSFFWLLASLMLSLLAIFFNKEFGLFLLAAIIAATLIYQWRQSRLFSLSALMGLLAGLVGAVIYFKFIPGKFVGGTYMLLGEGSPATEPHVIKNLLFVVTLSYFLVIFLRHVKDNMNYFWLSVLFYCQCLLIYYIWFPQFSHLLAIAAPFVLLFLSVLYLIIRYFNLEPHEKNILGGLFALLFLFIYIPNTLSFYDDARQYKNNFKTHRLYQWPFATARLTSTMEPKLFINAVSLIDKYNAAPGVYMISKYDTVLPVLAGKYTALPYPELLTSLINTNVLEHVASLIHDAKPEYLFVDRDIERNFNNEIYRKLDIASKLLTLDITSSDRVYALNRLHHLFEKIKHDYRPVESSELITVYQRVEAVRAETPTSVKLKHLTPHKRKIFSRGSVILI